MVHVCDVSELSVIDLELRRVSSLCFSMTCVILRSPKDVETISLGS